MNEIQLTLPALIYAFIEAFDSLGFPSKWKRLASIILGGTLNPVFDQSIFTGNLELISQSVLVGCLVGAGTTGVVAYQKGKK